MGTTLHTLKPAKGATRKPKRVGRGPGSGWGTTAGRGQKGQGSRRGGHKGMGFEGGQMPLARRLPKRGFKNIFRVPFSPVNVADLDKKFKVGEKVTPETLRERKLIRRNLPVKILGSGELKTKLTVSAHKFSKTARAKIEAVGGKVEELEQ